MRPRNYLPSKQFSLLAVSLFLSAGLVYAAETVTHPKAAALAVDERAQTIASGDWQADLASVQAGSGISAPQAPDQSMVDGLLQAAKSSNITDTISRSLLVNLAAAKQQGLGDDIPTQDQLVQNALSEVKPVNPDTQYTTSDLTLSDNSAASLRAYGNATMTIFNTYSDNEFAKTLVIINELTSGHADSASYLPPIQKKYAEIAKALVKVPVPKVLVPFHLELVNDYEKMAATYDMIGVLSSDPVQGLAGVQQYNSLTQNAEQMFINIAQTLDKNAILFNKDEPGATWAALLQSQQQ